VAVLVCLQVQLKGGYLEPRSDGDRDDQGETPLLGDAPHEGCEFALSISPACHREATFGKTGLGARSRLLVFVCVERFTSAVTNHRARQCLNTYLPLPMFVPRSCRLYNFFKVLCIPNNPPPTLGKDGHYNKHFHTFLEQCFQRDPHLRYFTCCTIRTVLYCVILYCSPLALAPARSRCA